MRRTHRAVRTRTEQRKIGGRRGDGHWRVGPAKGELCGVLVVIWWVGSVTGLARNELRIGFTYSLFQRMQK
jgi:hypothetical protein